MKNKYIALFCGWLVPGLGHAYAGRKWQGIVLFSVLTASSFIGLALGRFRNVYFEPSHYQFYAEVGNGLFTIVTSVAARLFQATPIEHTARGAYLADMLPVADLYLMIAGLLNFVAAANAFDIVAQAKAAQE